MSEFYQLNTPKELDIISDIQLHHETNLLVSAWSNEVILFQTQSFINNTHIEPQLDPVQRISTSSSTPLSLLYHPNYQTSIVGCLDGSINEIDFENNKLTSLVNSPSGQLEQSHAQGVNKLSLGLNNSIISSSFNGVIQSIDPRVNKITHTYTSDKQRKIFNMVTTSEKLILGLNSNIIEIYDLRNLSAPMEIREVGLKYQIKDLRTCDKDENKFAVSTIDGRVSIEYLNNEDHDKRFTFKCHRTKDKLTETDLVYPVNSIVFQDENYLYTGGSDGYVCLWDCSKKKRLKQFKQFTNDDTDVESISKLVVNDSGDLLVVGTSDDNYYRKRRLSQSENSKNPSKVYIKKR